MKTKDKSLEVRRNSPRRILPWVVAGVLILGVLSVMPSVWALPQQAPDFQTVPTLTPIPPPATDPPPATSAPTDTPVLPVHRRNTRRRCTDSNTQPRCIDRNTWRRHVDRNTWRRHADRFGDAYPFGGHRCSHWAGRLLDHANAWF